MTLAHEEDFAFLLSMDLPPPFRYESYGAMSCVYLSMLLSSFPPSAIYSGIYASLATVPRACTTSVLRIHNHTALWAIIY